MPIKLVIFDLDGVLIDTPDLHFLCFQQALEESGFTMTKEYHDRFLNGKSTREKLAELNQLGTVGEQFNETIYQRKQQLTRLKFKDVQPNHRLIYLLRLLKKQYNVLLYCASNSIWESVKNALLNCGFLDYIDYFISNEDVQYPKPNPQMYLECLKRANVSAEETVIVEDSPIGIAAAKQSGCHVLEIADSNQLTIDLLWNFIDQCNIDLYTKNNLNIVIPMAGLGSRFVKAGYTDPKPFITIDNQACLIQKVINNLSLVGHYIFIVRQEHVKRLKLLLPKTLDYTIVQTNKTTNGAACSVLLAEEFINDSKHLVIANSDQFVEWGNDQVNAKLFLKTAISENVDGLINTFTETEGSNKWSFAKVISDKVVHVAEKDPISNNATTGIYYWKKGSTFVRYAKQMINKDIKTNNEFYVCPVYNEAIQDSKVIQIYPCKKMWSLGTPEDLETYKETYKNSHFLK